MFSKIWHSLSRGFCLISVRSVVGYIFAVVTKNNAVYDGKICLLSPCRSVLCHSIAFCHKLSGSSVDWIAQWVERRSTVETRRCMFESLSRQPIFRCTLQNNIIELERVLLLSSLQEMHEPRMRYLSR